MKELHIQKGIVRTIRAMGGYAVSYYNGAQATTMGRAPGKQWIFYARFHKKDFDRPDGFPDIVGVYKGLPIAIEVKKPGQKSKPVQKKMHEMLNSFGWHSCECHSIDEAREFLESL